MLRIIVPLSSELSRLLRDTSKFQVLKKTVEHPSRLESSEIDLFYTGLVSTYGPFTL